MTGFHAIGSGSAMAQQAHALLTHCRMTERDVDFGVVDICRITADEATHLEPDEIVEVRGQIDRWIELERSALDGVFD